MFLNPTGFLLFGSKVNLVELGQLVGEKGNFKKPVDARLKVIPTRIPYRNKDAKDVVLNVKANYIFRHVKEGKESLVIRGARLR